MRRKNQPPYDHDPRGVFEERAGILNETYRIFSWRNPSRLSIRRKHPNHWYLFVYDWFGPSNGIWQSTEKSYMGILH